MQITGKIGFRVAKPWRRPAHLVFQVEADKERVWSHGIPGDIHIETRQQWVDANHNDLQACLDDPQSREIAAAIRQRAASSRDVLDHLDVDLHPTLTGKLGFRVVKPWWRAPLLIAQVEIERSFVKGLGTPGIKVVHTYPIWQDATLNSLIECLEIQRNKENAHG